MDMKDKGIDADANANANADANADANVGIELEDIDLSEGVGGEGKGKGGGFKIDVKSENSWAAAARGGGGVGGGVRGASIEMETRTLKVTKNVSKVNVLDVKDSISLESWMEDNYVDSALLFDSLNVVPTTHNSGAIYPRKAIECIPWFWAKCQSYGIYEQLMMGIRCFDLRLKLIRGGAGAGAGVGAGAGAGGDGGNRYQIVHFFESAYCFTEVMKEIHRFLDDNDGETVFVMMKPDWNTRKDWKFKDLEDLWGKIGGMERVLKAEDCVGKMVVEAVEGAETVETVDEGKLADLRFKHVRGKIIMMPDGHIYKTYKNSLGNGGKVNMGRDVDVIHGVKVVYPSFLNRCENWNSSGIGNAKRKIEGFLLTEKQRSSSLERRAAGDESKLFPLVETNVVLWKGVLPPYFAAKCIHPYLKNRCVRMECITDEGMCYINRFGFLLLDFANKDLVRKLLTNNLCW